MSHSDLPGVVVTGAAGGIGAAVAREACARGHRVLALVHRSTSEPALNVPGIHVEVADVTRESVSEAVVRGLAAAGISRVGILVNAAGAVRHGTTLASTSAESIMESLDVHCTGVMRVTRACLPALLQAPRPVVLNLTSRHGSLSLAASGGVPGVPVSYSYRIAKAAQNMLTACLHQELAPRVRFLAVHPGRVATAIAPADADRSPAVTADQLLDLAENAPPEWSGRFLEPPATFLDW
ncbi:SDR family NAD(P)-dependent oxidoreductase [Streptomyces rubiginosohelvolus]|uniref:SDR family NAD(P)-dependent oxidoreductase n=1 Tax=Streptomyces rubiginosohelvolus TaxID=67362 RepID=UPI0036B8C9CB